jgi:hypothetical protein
MRDPRDDDPSVRAAAPTHGPTGAGAVDPAQAADAAPAAGATAPVGAAGPLAATDPIAALTEALAAGAIDAETARTRLIAEVVRAQMPAGADPAVWAAIEAEVAAVLAGDPVLGDLLRA